MVGGRVTLSITYGRVTNKCNVRYSTANWISRIKFKFKFMIWIYINMCSLLDNVAINDVLPLKATRRDDTANFESFFLGGDTSDLILTSTNKASAFLASLYGATVFGCHQRNLPPPTVCRSLSSVCGPPCAKPGDEVECRIYGGGRQKLRSYFKPFVDQSS